MGDRDVDFRITMQLELCSAVTQKLTAKRRMNASEHAKFCELLDTKPFIAAYATTPLTLSLLIQLFKSQQLQVSDIDFRRTFPIQNVKGEKSLTFASQCRAGRRRAPSTTA